MDQTLVLYPGMVVDEIGACVLEKKRHERHIEYPLKSFHVKLKQGNVTHEHQYSVLNISLSLFTYGLAAISQGVQVFPAFACR